MKKIGKFFQFMGMLSMVIWGCVACDDDKKDDPFIVEPPETNNVMAIVVNEGQFTKGTASLTAITNDQKVQKDIFRTANNRPLGDVAQSITYIDGNYFVAVNNSKKVEVISALDFKSVETITFESDASPRYIAAINETEAIVSDQNAQIIKINTKTFQVEEFIPIEGAIEQMLKVGNKLFCANISGPAAGVYVYDVTDMKTPRKIETNSTPYKSTPFIEDKNGDIWALGGKMFLCIDPSTETVVKTVEIPATINLTWYPRMGTDGTKAKIYFDGKQDNKNYIFTLDVDKKAVDAEPYLELVGLGMTYGMNVSADGHVFVCDALDYSAQRGFVREYTPDGTVFSYPVGIFPSAIHFTTDNK